MMEAIIHRLDNHTIEVIQVISSYRTLVFQPFTQPDAVKLRTVG